MTIPNLLTMLRFALVPVVIWAISSDQNVIAFAVFVVAGLTDGIDGFIAKRWAMASQLGAYLDPLADKALLVSIFVALGVAGELPVWLVGIVVARDVLIVGAVVLSSLMGRAIAIRPLLVSKVTTVVQILLVALVLADLAFGLDLLRERAAVTLIVAGLTVISAAAYLVTWLRHMSEPPVTEFPGEDPLT
ncbi:CDP-alcohol phosphatidyltransferase family protein [Amorphus orientalis]|uniref:CDP-diacylglycerol--glycerol-3-phosphate 3-phosphatidyltransferase n=1 Tax=Amorphus orientalis TaxID=649198 RepID=A0AAE3VPM7_9HYPH|nr:CDP-alcohol phosphatidyltransferase family protein [Amorphus orientalis]MDQ0315723.1 cardiolipin synthase [Amorphus orientalis]